MKHENSTTKSRPALAIKTFLSGIALTALLGLSLNVQAQCTVDNWDSATNLTDDETGTQGAANRRYGGPCGLRVELDGTARYLTDLSPVGEGSYIVRFYAFFTSVAEDTMIFAAENDLGVDVIEIWYDNGNNGTLVFNIRDSVGTLQGLPPIVEIGSGWHSIELVWNASSEPENIRISVNEEGDTHVASVDTSGISLHAANLGNLNSRTGGSIDFDDFDSRRISRPGRLLVGDANNDGAITGGDLTSLVNELLGSAFAPGQPDCNEDGNITGGDLTCLVNVLLN